MVSHRFSSMHARLASKMMIEKKSIICNIKTFLFILFFEKFLLSEAIIVYYSKATIVLISNCTIPWIKDIHCNLILY